MYRAQYHFVSCTGHSWKVSGQPVHGSHREPGKGYGFDPVRIKPDSSGRVDAHVGQVTSQPRHEIAVVRTAAADEELLHAGRMPGDLTPSRRADLLADTACSSRPSAAKTAK